MLQRSPDRDHASPADLATCREMIRVGSRTFYLASLLLPQRLAGPALAIYAFCRSADDTIDVGERRIDALSDLRERLQAAYAGRPRRLAADRAFADVVRRFAIPRTLPEALLEGFEWDAAGRRYATASALQEYAARVAGSVGAMMALLMGARDPHALARACELGVAMQLSNIARDVGEDARAGRLYLPLEWMQEAGLDPQRWLERPVFSEALAAVVYRLLALADELYARSIPGVAALPNDCRTGIHAARLLYAEIGHEVARNGGDSISQRAVVPWHRKLAGVAAALTAELAAARGAGASARAPGLPETRFLVDAVAAWPTQPGPAAREVPWWNLRAGFESALELFHDLERRQAQDTPPDADAAEHP
jgi:phytoene synthase